MKKLALLTLLPFFFLSQLIGQTGEALHFDGSDDEISLGQVNELDNVNAFTIEFWAKEAGTSGNKFFWATGSSATNNIRFLRNTVSNRYLMRMSLAGAVGEAFVYVPISSSWRHFAIVYDGAQATNAGKIKIYLDGVAQAITFNNTFPSTTPTAAGDFKIGISSSFNLGSYMHGTLDEFRIWSTVRTAGQISANKDSEINPNDPDLIAYYQFNQGIAGGNNTSPAENTLTDNTGGGKNGTLTNFDLNGSTSNWVGGSPVLSAGPVPTLGEWGMIILALIMGVFATLALAARKEVALATAGNKGISSLTALSLRYLPFDKKLFAQMLAIVLGVSIGIFAVAILAFGYELTSADVPGVLIAAPVAAYLVHLWANKK